MFNPFEITRNLLYILQVEEYHLDRFWRWLRTHREWTGLERKKKLVWTIKAKLLFLFAVLIWITSWALVLSFAWIRLPSLLLVLVILVFLAFGKSSLALALILAYLILEPVSWFAAIWIVKKAERKRKEFPDLKVIGISGSFGKTSVKEILSHILSAKYRVLKTPENINTLLGIARLILNQLNREHQVLIVEIGAYRKEDTRAVAKLIKPQIGILTGINEQHFERFGSMENIIATESELLEELPSAGLAILNKDDSYYEEIRKRVAKNTAVLDFSIQNLKNVELSENGSRFAFEENSKDYTFETKLLGRHNISNILPAIFTARHLRLSFEEIQERVQTLEAPEHRLKLIQRAGDILILDDSYNVNPDGARAALEVLSLFKNRRKIVITHGLVELGEKERELHRKFGENLGKAADIVILAGPKTPLIVEGLCKAGFPEKQTIKASDISDAIQKFRQIAKSRDIALIQTDLPDSYY